MTTLRERFPIFFDGLSDYCFGGAPVDCGYSIEVVDDGFVVTTPRWENEFFRTLDEAHDCLVQHAIADGLFMGVGLS
jgi:hypothetical protein